MDNYTVSVQRFDEFADEFAQRFSDVSGYKTHLSLFCNSVKTSHAQILELACGPGNVTRFIKERIPDSRILAIDLAPKMIEIAKSTLPDVNFRVMDVRNISEIGKTFDAVMCSFCLPFLSKTDAEKLITDCASCLNPGGVMYLSTMEGDENREGFESTSFSGNAKVYFNYHLEPDLEASFRKAGFTKIKSKRQNYFEPDGSITTDLIFLVFKD
jgi:ubiquinone/menaquinone biosynthesis C-methylase UbiE